MKKYLIVGLGNKGEEYRYTRHNIGFLTVEHLAEIKEVKWESVNFGWQTRFNHKGKQFILHKPDTYMNLSGNAVDFWLKKEKIPTDQLLIITDDIHLPYGTFRMKNKGSDGGHNGLKNIQEKLQTATYPRLRFGVGNEFFPGRQVDYVLGKWSEEEMEHLPLLLSKASNSVLQFGLAGIQFAMNKFNGNHL